MINFEEDENLGKVISKKQLFSFGAAPLTGLKELVFAAGGDKFSSLCGFKFTSKADTEYKEFFIAFVCKLRSKIFHTAVSNPSQWFIFKKISPVEMHCLDKKTLLLQYGFDIEKFFLSDYFLKTLPKFKATVKKGLEVYVPEYVKAHGDELAKDNLTSYDGQLNATVKQAVGRYVTAIADSLKFINDTLLLNNKFYKLISHNLTVESILQTSEWKKLQLKWQTPQEGDLVAEILKLIPDMLDNMHDTFKFEFKDYEFENAIIDVIDDELTWKESDTPEKFIKNVIDKLFDNRDNVHESLNEDKLVEAGKWECEVEEDKDGKFSVYEKAGHVWAATFASKKAADKFAKDYPLLKAEYLKSANKDDSLVEADDREPLSHAFDIVGVKASTANTAAQDAVEMSVIEKEMDNEIEEAIKEIYK